MKINNILDGIQSATRIKLLMNYSMEKTLNENTLALQKNNNTTEVVITEWLSPDENYVIFLDELYDLSKSVHIGNIWENFDNFKLFLTHSFSVAKNIPTTIKESILGTLNNNLLFESKTNSTELKYLVKSNINEWSIGDAATWVKDWAVKNGVEAYTGTTDFVKNIYKGGEDTVSAISNGDWAQALEIIKGGVIYLARSIRSAMYHPVGMILDTILIATGIGKTVQWIPWAFIVALDVYEILNNDYEDPDMPVWLRYLFLGIDCMGLIMSGGVAIAARGLMKPLLAGVKTWDSLAVALRKSPKLKSILQSIWKVLSYVPAKLGEAIKYLGKVFPKGANFISKISTGIQSILSKIGNFIKKVLSGPKAVVTPTTIAGKVGAGAKAGAMSTGIIAGMDAGIEQYAKSKNNSAEEDVVNNLLSDEDDVFV